MSVHVDAPSQDELRAAMHARLVVVAGAFGVPADLDSTAVLLARLAADVAREDDPEHAWLLWVGITGTFPHTREVERLRRALALAAPGAALAAALTAAIDAGGRSHAALRTIELTDVPLVDVDFCARWEHNTGIQRVVRHTVPEWIDRGESVRLVAWTQDSTGYVDLDEIQEDRVLHWNDRRHPDPDERPRTEDELRRSHLVVPWRGAVVIAEVPAHHNCDTLTAIAKYTSNRVGLIGYDAIPLVSADTLPPAEAERFAHYLTIVKHADVVAGISAAAAEEFRSFVRALPSQGITGPRVDTVTLATEVSESAQEHAALARSTATDADIPLLLCVGSHEPRKNQDAVLFAAELLYREGHRFRIVFVGGGSRAATIRFDTRVATLKRQGMLVESHRRLSDAELWGLFARARFSVFVSLHEGFGLPVAESIALGVPVLASDYGAVDEIARMGGCLQVDPRDDAAIVGGMRDLLTDDALVARLRDQIPGITTKSWGDYAAELRSTLLEEVRA